MNTATPPSTTAIAEGLAPDRDQLSAVRVLLDEPTNSCVDDVTILEVAESLGDEWQQRWFQRGVANLVSYAHAPLPAPAR